MGEMDFDSFKALVFAATTERDGAWSWHQLDRHLVVTSPEMIGEMTPALRDLEAEGKILSIPNGANPGMPRYKLSSATC